jgi:hypothetical protein
VIHNELNYWRQTARAGFGQIPNCDEADNPFVRNAENFVLGLTLDKQNFRQPSAGCEPCRNFIVDLKMQGSIRFIETIDCMVGTFTMAAYLAQGVSERITRGRVYDVEDGPGGIRIEQSVKAIEHLGRAKSADTDED